MPGSCNATATVVHCRAAKKLLTSTTLTAYSDVVSSCGDLSSTSTTAPSSLKR